jgi:hypothetical protein
MSHGVPNTERQSSGEQRRSTKAERLNGVGRARPVRRISAALQKALQKSSVGKLKILPDGPVYYRVLAINVAAFAVRYRRRTATVSIWKVWGNISTRLSSTTL